MRRSEIIAHDVLSNIRAMSENDGVFYPDGITGYICEWSKRHVTSSGLIVIPAMEADTEIHGMLQLRLEPADFTYEISVCNFIDS